MCLHTATSVLWLTFLLTLTTIWSILLGCSLVRIRIHTLLSTCFPCNSAPSFRRQNRLYSLTVVFSVSVQVIATVISGYLLRSTHTGPLIPGFFSRPLPGVAVIWAASVDWRMYGNNAAEVFLCECVYGLASIAVFGGVAVGTNPLRKSRTGYAYVTASKLRLQGFPIARTGAALGVLFFIWTVAVELYGLLREKRWHIRPRRYVVGTIVHLLASVLVWVGVLMLTEDYPWARFCPSNHSVARISSVWILVTALDHLGRACIVQ